ncbi:MAG: acetate kinase [Gammaproteobacteria bacterium]|jgi:acetate kinase
MRILVINSGSSSVKYQLLDMDRESVLTSGVLERIGEAESRLVHRWRVDGGQKELRREERVADHQHALECIAAALKDSGSLSASSGLDGIGHRVVHGGEDFTEPTLIDAAVVERIRALSPLAPLHNPANLTGIEVCLRLYPDLPQVAVFDTAFHQTMPAHAYRYAVPQGWYRDHRVRRYGFHGTSHRHVACQAAAFLQRPLATLNLITLHLGNGASAAAIQGGRCVDTSMGLTPLEGLIMGTRCGDIDPAIPFYLARAAGASAGELEAELNRSSGLKGICGVNDMREIQRRAASGDARARLALDMYCYRIRKYIGAYFAVLGHVDALVFTAGIGENSAPVRETACLGLERLGIAIDSDRNRAAHEGAVAIERPGAVVRVLAIPTNEEIEIARQTLECIGS